MVRALGEQHARASRRHVGEGRRGQAADAGGPLDDVPCARKGASRRRPSLTIASLMAHAQTARASRIQCCPARTQRQPLANGTSTRRGDVSGGLGATRRAPRARCLGRGSRGGSASCGGGRGALPGHARTSPARPAWASPRSRRASARARIKEVRHRIAIRPPPCVCRFGLARRTVLEDDDERLRHGERRSWRGPGPRPLSGSPQKSGGTTRA